LPDLRIAALVSVVVILALSAGLPTTAQTGGAVDTAEFEKAAGAIRCDCGCHPQSAKDCACGRAAEMRGEIGELIAKGMTGDEVIAQYVAQQGEQIRLAPTASGFNLVAWLGPFAGLLLASGAMFALLRRWKRGHPATEPLPATPGVAVDAAYDDRLRKALERLD
jgi:cytochrome c-type biogenesis protein CcmH